MRIAVLDDYHQVFNDDRAIHRVRQRATVDVFTEELLENYISYKRKNEADAVRLRPHPYEFALYYDI